jgi:hypothetical protein
MDAKLFVSHEGYIDMIVSKFLAGNLTNEVTEAKILQDLFAQLIYQVRDLEIVIGKNEERAVKISQVADGRMFVGASLGFLAQIFPHPTAMKDNIDILLEMHDNKELVASLLFGDKQKIHEALFYAAYDQEYKLVADPNWYLRMRGFDTLFNRKIKAAEHQAKSSNQSKEDVSTIPHRTNINKWMDQLRPTLENELQTLILVYLDKIHFYQQEDALISIEEFKKISLKHPDAEQLAACLKEVIEKVQNNPILVRQARDDLRIIEAKYLFPKDDFILARIPPWIYLLGTFAFPILAFLKGDFITFLILLFAVLIGLVLSAMVWLMAENEKARNRQDLRIILLRWKSYLQEISKS